MTQACSTSSSTNGQDIPSVLNGFIPTQAAIPTTSTATNNHLPHTPSQSQSVPSQLEQFHSQEQPPTALQNKRPRMTLSSQVAYADVATQNLLVAQALDKITERLDKIEANLKIKVSIPGVLLQQ